MDVENKFHVEVTEDNKVHVIQKIIKTMSIEESMVEYNKLKGEHEQVMQNITKTQKYIDDNEAEKTIKSLQDNDETLKSLTTQWEEKTKPLLEELKKKVKRAIIKQKIQKGYARENDVNKKVVTRANVLGDVANTYNLDINHPIIQEFRKNFDKI